MVFHAGAPRGTWKRRHTSAWERVRASGHAPGGRGGGAPPWTAQCRHRRRARLDLDRRRVRLDFDHHQTRRHCWRRRGGCHRAPHRARRPLGRLRARLVFCCPPPPPLDAHAAKALKSPQGQGARIDGAKKAAGPRRRGQVVDAQPRRHRPTHVARQGCGGGGGGRAAAAAAGPSRGRLHNNEGRQRSVGGRVSGAVGPTPGGGAEPRRVGRRGRSVGGGAARQSTGPVGRRGRHGRHRPGRGAPSATRGGNAKRAQERRGGEREWGRSGDRGGGRKGGAPTWLTLAKREDGSPRNAREAGDHN